MIKKHKHPYLLRLAAVIAASLMLLCACSCAGSHSKQSVSTLNTITPAEIDPVLHYSKTENALSVKAAESGLIQLYVDPESCSFSILDTAGNQCWSALPLLSTDADAAFLQNTASMVSLDVLANTDIYKLNSQDNSLAFSTAKYELTENGAVFTYNLFPDAATASKQSFEKSDIAFCVKMAVTLKDGSMNLSCTYENLSGNTDAKIINLDVLNYFGAFNQSEEDDFVLVPDGCGAIIKTAVYDDSFEPLSFAVYGNDAASGHDHEHSACIPAFGMKHASSAFVALITKGDALACINADKATNSSEYNIVNAQFSVTPYVYENEKLYISDESYSSEDGIELCYRFLSGGNATYSGLASACREQLIRNRVLSTRTVESGGYLPMNLTVIGAAYSNTTANTGFLRILTDFEQALDMLTHMKNKGINGVNLRYCGIFDGGTNQKEIDSSADILRRLGSESGLQELYSYVDSQNMQLFLDVNLLSSSSGFSSSENAVDLHGNKLKADFENSLSKYIGNDVYSRTLRSPSGLDKTVKNLLKDTRYYSFSGFCLNDVGTTLYSTYGLKPFNTAQTASIISQAITPLTTNKPTMTVYGNFYAIKNVDIIVDLPLETSVSESGSYMAVPFLQLILHSSIDYSGKPLNLYHDPQEAMLRHIEYGACPGYEWCYEKISSEENSDFYYDSWINSAADFYTKANDALGDLRDARIVDHSQVSDGVFLTEYDNGALIYVNYTDKDFNTKGVIVNARDFMRVN